MCALCTWRYTCCMDEAGPPHHPMQRKAGDMSNEAMAVNGQFLTVNPDEASLWNYRRTVLLARRPDRYVRGDLWEFGCSQGTALRGLAGWVCWHAPDSTVCRCKPPHGHAGQ